MPRKEKSFRQLGGMDSARPGCLPAGRFSKRTEYPHSDRMRPAVDPAGPPPITTTSNSSIELSPVFDYAPKKPPINADSRRSAWICMHRRFPVHGDSAVWHGRLCGNKYVTFRHRRRVFMRSIIVL